ncbi:MAG: hypothetical protein P8129_02015 [Anaerolineae bacterium]
MASVALVATIHQPDERLAGLMEAQLPALARRYAALVAYCSRDTHPAMLDLLRRHGAAVEVDGEAPAGIRCIGRVRRQTIRAGLAAGTSHLQMCDFDRILHWMARYPSELDEVIAAIGDYDLLVLGRTERAWATHPPYQSETEPIFNHVFYLATGKRWDVGAGSRGLSRRAAELLLSISTEETVGVDAEWPVLLLKQPPDSSFTAGGFCLGYRACDGLEFETADRFGPEIEAAVDCRGRGPLPLGPGEGVPSSGPGWGTPMAQRSPA